MVQGHSGAVGSRGRPGVAGQKVCQWKKQVQYVNYTAKCMYLYLLKPCCQYFSQGEPGARGPPGPSRLFGPGGNTGIEGAKGQKGLLGQTVS